MFSSTSCHVRIHNLGGRLGQVIDRGLFVLDKLRVPNIITLMSTSTADLSSFHLNSSFSTFYLSGALGKLQISDIFYCCGCKFVKFSAFPFNKSIDVSNAPFDLVHFDVWGPSLVFIKGGSRYYVFF